MKKQNRRQFLKAASVITASSLAAGPVRAAPKNILDENRFGVLVDTTECIGCRKCEYACKTAHGITPDGPETYTDRSVFDDIRRPDEKNLTVVNAYPVQNGIQNTTTVKVQCMHCDYPACVSACIVGAFTKETSGAVIWDEDKCIGCRYCMVACPFQIPAYEYHQAIGARVVKCDWCLERTSEGKLPACVGICPVEALRFGKRSELLKVAQRKIRSNPEKYIDHIYGEKEAGGTGWLYLASVNFASFGFPNLNDKPAPGVSEAIQHGIFAYFVPPAALYALLGGVMWLNRKKSGENEEQE